MATEPFRGVFTIAATPFDDAREVDWSGFRSIIDFCIACGAHGICWPLNASGFTVLTDQERLEGMRVMVEQVAGRIPVVLGVQGVSAKHAAQFARHAAKVGADAVVAMTPYAQPLEDEDAIVDYYRAINVEVDVPIMIQNHARGSVLSVDTMVRVLHEVERVAYVKEETFPVTHKITQLIERGGDKLKGVFGGAGGRYLLLEHPRGVAGQMPGCHVTDLVVRLWNALEAGDRAEAKRVFALLGPLFSLEMLKGVSYTEVLRRRGVIRGSSSRLSIGTPREDVHDHLALDDILRDLEPHFTWSNGPILYGVPPWIRDDTHAVVAPTGSGGVDTFDRIG
ncbi:MAG TPA: dihydrodipicolinate synthase family protein [Phycisphaeraceae bacterium]